jgi:hypothetical protein|tara:strand:+ start:2551 stop:2730 length:180 start_codon:yes stop_codon:yes gene_type:complete
MTQKWKVEENIARAAAQGVAEKLRPIIEERDATILALRELLRNALGFSDKEFEEYMDEQ